MKKFFVVFAVLFLVIPNGFAKTFKVKNPASVNTDLKKLERAHVLMEKLRLLHNKKGKDYTDGIITEQEWLTWKEGYFRERQEAIVQQIIKSRQALQSAVTFEANLDGYFEENLN